MAYLAQEPPQAVRPHPSRRRHVGRSPLTGPVLLFVAATVTAAAYVAYVLWPRWPEAPVTLDAPSLPIVIAGVVFNIEPAAIRMAVERRPGAQDRVDLAYLWPSLVPPDPALKATVGAPVDPNERLFRHHSNRRRHAAAARTRADDLSALSGGRSRSPDPRASRCADFATTRPIRARSWCSSRLAPEHFLARCSRKGVINSGICLLERRIGNADITIRFPRDWLTDWQNVANGIDRLIARLHPNS